MASTHFEMMNKALHTMYGKIASKRTYTEFMRYCQKGVEISGVKPVINPVNLYAFGNRISSAEAYEIWGKRISGGVS